MSKVILDLGSAATEGFDSLLPATDSVSEPAQGEANSLSDLLGTEYVWGSLSREHPAQISNIKASLTGNSGEIDPHPIQLNTLRGRRVFDAAIQMRLHSTNVLWTHEIVKWVVKAMGPGGGHHSQTHPPQLRPA